MIWKFSKNTFFSFHAVHNQDIPSDTTEERKYPVFDESIDEIHNTEKEFWENKIQKCLKPPKEDKDRAENIKRKLVSLRNRTCLFVFLLNAILVTLMYSLTQANSFSDSLSIIFVCHGKDFKIAPIAILFTIAFGFLLLVQFICMVYHRFSTLVHITANTPVWENEESKLRKIFENVGQYMTTNNQDPPKESSAATDKNRTVETVPFQEPKVKSMKRKAKHLKKSKDEYIDIAADIWLEQLRREKKQKSEEIPGPSVKRE